MTSGGMTPVIDGLERQGLVEHVPNPGDRRGSLVRLTRSGKAAVDRAMVLHAEAEHVFFSGLANASVERLERLCASCC